MLGVHGEVAHPYISPLIATVSGVIGPGSILRWDAASSPKTGSPAPSSREKSPK